VNTVGSIMSKELVTVEMDATLEDIQNLFAKHMFHRIFVVENKELVGVITDRDFFREISPNLDTIAERKEDHLTLEKKVLQVMTRDLITVTEDTSLENAAATMMENQISCLPVMDPEKGLLGAITLKDILRYFIRGEIKKSIQFMDKPPESKKENAEDSQS